MKKFEHAVKEAAERIAKERVKNVDAYVSQVFDRVAEGVLKTLGIDFAWHSDVSINPYKPLGGMVYEAYKSAAKAWIERHESSLLVPDLTAAEIKRFKARYRESYMSEIERLAYETAQARARADVVALGEAALGEEDDE